jgi:hypothetical protein
MPSAGASAGLSGGGVVEFDTLAGLSISVELNSMYATSKEESLPVDSYLTPVQYSSQALSWNWGSTMVKLLRIGMLNAWFSW